MHRVESGKTASKCDEAVDRQRRWCVFTSAGDHHNVMGWGPGNPDRKWDLVVAFYGDNETEFEQLKSISSTAVRSKGSKFQNLKKLFQAQPSLFEKYDFVFVCDDDIFITPDQIERLFQIAARYGFWITQPAFSAAGRISHDMTNKLGSQIRLTNFIEVTCPLFRTDKLIEFLQVYDGSLVGWGVDWWYSSYFNAENNRKFAVADEIVVLNPHDHQRRGGAREIEGLQPDQVRETEWQQKAEELGIWEYEIRTLAYIVDTGADGRESKADNSSYFLEILYTELEHERLTHLETRRLFLERMGDLNQILYTELEQARLARLETQRLLLERMEDLNQKLEALSRGQLAGDIAREVYLERRRRGLLDKIGKKLKRLRAKKVSS